MTYTRRHNQRIVTQFLTLKDDFLLFWIQIDDLIHQHLRIFVTAENGTQRRRDISWRKCSRCHLVEQRLEQMKVSLVDQRYICRSAFERLGRVQPPKSATNNHNPV